MVCVWKNLCCQVYANWVTVIELFPNGDMLLPVKKIIKILLCFEKTKYKEFPAIIVWSQWILSTK